MDSEEVDDAEVDQLLQELEAPRAIARASAVPRSKPRVLWLAAADDLQLSSGLQLLRLSTHFMTPNIKTPNPKSMSRTLDTLIGSRTFLQATLCGRGGSWPRFIPGAARWRWRR